MRVLKFDGNSESHRNIFAGLLGAWRFKDPEHGLPLVRTHTSAERTENAIELERFFRESSTQTIVGNGRSSFELREQGAEIQLRDSGADLLREFWVAFKTFQPPEAGEQILEVDAFLKDLPVAKEDAQPKPNGRAKPSRITHA